jgi:hypothetical protein
MYRSETDVENNGRVQKVRIFNDVTQLTYIEVLRRWQTDDVFRTFFISVLAAAPYTSYRWETPPVTKNTLNRLFEFVILDSPYLDQIANPAQFQEFLDRSNVEDVAVFPNLGKDAILIVPTPKKEQNIYAHIASFIRQAGEDQKHAFWQKVGEIMQQSVGEKPVWLNTAGAGVSWLHVRLDSFPKYYGYSPYKNFP